MKNTETNGATEMQTFEMTYDQHLRAEWLYKHYDLTWVEACQAIIFLTKDEAR